MIAGFSNVGMLTVCMLVQALNALSYMHIIEEGKVKVFSPESSTQIIRKIAVIQ